MSLHLSKCHIVGNYMPRLINVFAKVFVLRSMGNELAPSHTPSFEILMHLLL